MMRHESFVGHHVWWRKLRRVCLSPMLESAHFILWWRHWYSSIRWCHRDPSMWLFISLMCSLSFISGCVDSYSCIIVRLDFQADKSSVVVKGPFFPHVWTQGIESVEQCVTHDPI
jgi:hypothetical protein